MATSNLYFLIFPKISAIKIGKANDLENRYQSLKRSWGDADLINSYYVEFPIDEVYKYEKSLHILFSKFNKNLIDGDGKTEFFEIEILNEIVDFFHKYTNFNVIKGIVLNKKVKVIDRKIFLKKNKLKKANIQTFKTLNNICLQLFRLSKLIIFITKYEGKIIFQYDLVDDKYYFRMKLDENLSDEQFQDLIQKIWNLLSYKYICHRSSAGFALSTWSTWDLKAKTFQMVIIDPLNKNVGSVPKAFKELWIEMIQPILLKLPKQSQANIDGLPLEEWNS